MTAPPTPQRKQEHYETGWCAANYGCQRPECVEAHRRYKRRAKKRSRMGVATPQYTSIGPSRARVHADMEAGYTLPQLARMYGVTYSLVVDLSAEHVQRKQVLAKNARKIKYAVLTEPPNGQLPSLATQRRVQALIRDGHSQDQIRQYLADRGVRVSSRWASDVAVGKYPTTSGERHRAIEDIFEKLVLQPGTCEKARAWGRRMGWTRPMSWDPETIDLPAAKPFVADDPERCVECQTPMLTRVLYYDLDVDDRVGWSYHGAHGYCRSCYKRAVDAGTLELGLRTG